MLGSDDSANVTGQATSSRPSGSKRRQEAACLPKPFFVMIKKENKMVLLGAMVLVAAEQCCGSEFVWWTVSPYVPLLSRTVVEPSDFEYRSTVCKLKGKAEARIRRSHALVGGNLNDHMVAYAAQVWRCILIPDAASTLFLCENATPHGFSTKVSYARQMGIVPAMVNRIADPEPEVLDKEIDNDTDIFVGAGIQDQDQPAQPAPKPARAASAGGVDAALARMQQNTRPNNLHGHQFTPDAVLSFLKLASNLKASATLEQTLADAGAIFFGTDGSLRILEALRNKAVHAPGLDMMRQARLRLDLCNLAFERCLFLQYEITRYLITDKSPQLGFNFSITREDRLLIPKPIAVNIVSRAKINLNEVFSTRIAPISAAGLGRAHILAQTDKLLNIYKMESANKPDFNLVRRQVKNITTDQAEKNLNDAGLIGQAADNVTPSSSEAYAFSESLWMPGHIHIYFDGLEETTKELDVYDSWISNLRDAQNFLIEAKWRRKYQETCLVGTGHYDEFTSYSATHHRLALGDAINCAGPDDTASNDHESDFRRGETFKYRYG